MTYQQEVMADTPLVYYRLGEPSGTTMVDSSGNNRNGGYTAPLTLAQTGLQTGDSDKCIDFSGGRGTYFWASWLDVDFFTAEAIFVTDTIAGQHEIIAHDNIGVGLELAWRVRTNGTAIEGLWQTSSSGVKTVSSGAGAISAGTRYHVALTYDGFNLRLYLNGAQVGVVSQAGVTVKSNQPFYVASLGNGSEPFDGRIDEVAFYGTALSAARITAHYAALDNKTSLGAGVFMPTINDLQRSWLLKSMGMTNPALSVNDLMVMLFSDPSYNAGSRKVSIPAPKTGAYIFPLGGAALASLATLGNSIIRLSPWIVESPFSITKFGAEVVTVGDAGSKVRLGMYLDDGTGYPGALLFDAGQIAGDSATVQELTVNQALPVGILWVAAGCQAAATTQPVLRGHNTGNSSVYLGSSVIPTAAGMQLGYQMTGISGALPATAPAGMATTGAAIRTFVKAA